MPLTEDLNKECGKRNSHGGYSLADEAPEEAEDKQKPSRLLFARSLIRTLYSPRRAFKEIVEKPDVKGVLLLLILVSSLSVGALYVSGSKILIVPLPESDPWTEPEALPLWNANGDITFDEADVIVGNASLVSSVSSSSTIWLNLTDIGAFDLTTGELQALSVAIKRTISEDLILDTAVLTFFSSYSDSRFELNILDIVPKLNDQWVPLTVDVGPENPDFDELVGSAGSPEWDNITGIGIRLSWIDSLDITVKLDGVAFGEYVLFGSTRFFEGWLSQLSLYVIFDFFLKWMLFAAGLWLIIGFAKKRSPFRDLLYVAGYCFSCLIVYVVIRFFLFLVIPPFATLDALSSYMLLISMLIFNIWPIVLGAFALAEMHEFSTKRALYLSVSSYFVYFFVANLLVFGISLHRVLFALP